MAHSYTPRRTRQMNEVPLRITASSAQQRLWFAEQMCGSGRQNHVPWAARLSGSLNVERMLDAIRALATRHEALRTRFGLEEGRLVQILEPQLEPDVRYECDDGITEDELRQLLEIEAGRPFDLEHESPMRALLVRTATESHVILLTLHHLVCDGWSMDVLVEDLWAIYDGAPPSARPDALQFADIVAWESEVLDDARNGPSLQYWHNKLESTPMLELPADMARPSVRSGRGGHVTAYFDMDLVTGIDRMIQDNSGTTRAMVLLAAFQALLARLTDSIDFAIAVPVANRNRVETEQVVGLLANTLAIRSSVGGDSDFRQCVIRVRASMFEAFEHQDVPFERVVEALAPERDPSYTAIAQALFAWQGRLSAGKPPPPLIARRLFVDTGGAKTDIALEVGEESDGLAIVLEYSTDLFSPEGAAVFLARYERLLRTAVASPQRRLSSLPLLSESERA
ncbi:MAG: hypothetical protein GY785_13440, partial [Gammaproteobacteria bacterium]|nr:hypothetical protein [Gammaproteobacteria bacterium]